jgi:hypothetical protein
MNCATLPTEATRREDGGVARRPSCSCGTCARCKSREYSRNRRRDPAYLAAEAAAARARRAAKARDKAWRERERARRRARYRALVADPAWQARRNATSRRTMARRRARLRSAILPGKTLAELAERTGRPRADLEVALASELRLGRVVTAARGRYALVAAEFPPDLLAALRGLYVAGSVDGQVAAADFAVRRRVGAVRPR